MTKIKMTAVAVAAYVALIALPFSASALAAESAETLQKRIDKLETEIEKIKKTQDKAASPTPDAPATARRNVFGNRFNPSIGIILNGQYSRFSSREGEVGGFAVGEEGERPREGFAVDHTELNFSANVDDKFFGSMTAAIAHHEGATEVELEEAYIQTLPGLGLPNGMSLKGGRAFWTFGYLNEHHSHVDDFADRPLPYRVFLNEAFNDDGVEISYLLPIEFYTEIGAGIFRGDDFPFGEGNGEGISAWSVFARFGGDIGSNQSWRLGGYVLSGEATGERGSNEDEILFTGDTDLYAIDLRYVWAPTGNARNQEVIFQFEHFWREEDGIYTIGIGESLLDDSSSGWYAQAVYKFAPQWRVGFRYSQLNASNVPDALADTALDDQGHDPKSYSVMLDWTNSEFGRVRLQYNREEFTRGQNDNQFILQYIMSIGAHGAHKY